VTTLYLNDNPFSDLSVLNALTALVTLNLEQTVNVACEDIDALAITLNVSLT
jgi:hypothetical protein